MVLVMAYHVNKEEILSELIKFHSNCLSYNYNYNYKL